MAEVLLKSYWREAATDAKEQGMLTFALLPWHRHIIDAQQRSILQ